MLGAIAGDIIGSPYEFANIKCDNFPLFAQKSRFTDDTVLTVATAEVLLRGLDFAEAYRRWGRAYPGAGYGGRFRGWLRDVSMGPYNSYGNGSAMRVSPVGFIAKTLDEALDLARKSASVTHNHPEGVKGAEAVAASVFLARHRLGKEDLKAYIESEFGYDLSFSLAEIRPSYRFNETCQGSVPQALRAVLEASGYEECVRLAVSIGGDSDTIACIAGGIAEAYWGVPPEIEKTCRALLAPPLLDVLDAYVQAGYGNCREGLENVQQRSL